MIDERYYTKEYAKGQFKKMGWFLYWIGSCNFYFSDRRGWSGHFYWWHPATWIIYITCIFLYGFENIKEINREMFTKKENRMHPYRKAK